MIKKTGIALWNWTPVVLWMALIFFASSIKGDDIPNFNIPNMDKLFHFVEYYILGVLLVRAFMGSAANPNFKFILLASVLTASSFGALDEFHQRFVTERSPEIFDVVFDIIGSFLGASLSIYKERMKSAVDKTI
jgi:VanZ family protein